MSSRPFKFNIHINITVTRSIRKTWSYLVTPTHSHMLRSTLTVNTVSLPYTLLTCPHTTIFMCAYECYTGIRHTGTYLGYHHHHLPTLCVRPVEAPAFCIFRNFSFWIDNVKTRRVIFVVPRSVCNFVLSSCIEDPFVWDETVIKHI